MTDNRDPLKSESVQNFLKSVYTLQQRMERVSTNALADVLLISAPSVTDMAQRLEEAGLIDYQKYKGVLLTNTGEQLALKIIRRHRLIELFLVEELGYELREVHQEAERLEHAVSDRFIDALAQKLDDPDFDPHGDPIPAADGTIALRDLQTLIEYPLDTPAVVSRIKSNNPEMLQHIVDRGFKLGAQVMVLSRDPFDGPVIVRVDEREQIIGYNVAQCVQVETPPT
jgi:DtxR family transcriptional regulator, Mn-dependent transcriptional regulator